MSQKYLIAITATLLFSASALAQNGANAGMGGPDGDYASLYELVSGHEKKCDSFNVFLNTGGSFNADENGGAFSGRQAIRNKTGCQPVFFIFQDSSREVVV